MRITLGRKRTLMDLPSLYKRVKSKTGMGYVMSEPWPFRVAHILFRHGAVFASMEVDRR
jgi:hypothetical protein